MHQNTSVQHYCRFSLQCLFTLAVTLGPFFFSSAWEPLGNSRKNTDATIIVTATKNFIFLSQARTMKDPKPYSCERRKCCSRTPGGSGRPGRSHKLLHSHNVHFPAQKSPPTASWLAGNLCSVQSLAVCECRSQLETTHCSFMTCKLFFKALIKVGE